MGVVVVVVVGGRLGMEVVAAGAVDFVSITVLAHDFLSPISAPTPINRICQGVVRVFAHANNSRER